MEHGACNVIYITRRANDEHVRRESLSSSLVARTSTGNGSLGYFGKPPSAEVHDNVETILSTFNEVYICASGHSCLDRIAQLQESAKANVPTIVLIDIPYDEEQRMKRLSREPRTPSPSHNRVKRSDTVEPDDIYGMHLLMHVYSEIQSQNFSKLVIPVVVLTGLGRDQQPNSLASPGLHGPQILTDTVRLVRYLDAGAVDVLASPLSKDNVQGLAVHAYRVHKEVSRTEPTFLTTRKNRKLSWVGVNDAKPYAYLREAMVSSLMSGICNPESVGESLDSADLFVEEDRLGVIATAIGSWSFSAHEFTDDELVHGALLMLKHALQMPGLEEWHMSDDDLLIFLLASRTAYNEFVLYHNFRHVSDVLQALFYFLVQIDILPPYPQGSAPRVDATTPKSPIAQLLTPFDALTLLISAIGHDVGHPGVNNAFLVALNAPLAQLYNDRSVLESFHCAAYSQILRRYWPRAFANSDMRKLMINSILATDMGLHFKYMSDLGNLQQKIANDQGVMDSWNAKVRDDHKDLACGLLIKCADISNVARKFDVAAKWANILTDEFSNQGVMEEELQVPSCLFGGPPVRDDLIKLGESQVGFINIFARPLFEAVTDILPGMVFAVDEMLSNKATWEMKMEESRQKMKKTPAFRLGLLPPSFSKDPYPSPFSGAPLKPPTDAPLARQSRLDGMVQASNQVDTKVFDHRESVGSNEATLSTSASSIGLDKSSSVPGVRASPLSEEQSQSRRGSGDASLTAIIVTEAPNAGDGATTDLNGDSGTCSTSPGKRKDTLTRYSPKKTHIMPSNAVEKEGVRPVTAPPASARHSQVNGTADSSKSHQWDPTLLAADNAMRPDASRDSNRKSEWWRQLSTRRRTRDLRNGDTDAPGQHKEMMLDRAVLQHNADTNATSPTSLSPGRNVNTRTGKLKTFFKRKPRTSDDNGKQLSSFGSSSQLRTPPTSDPGVSVNSDD